MRYFLLLPIGLMLSGCMPSSYEIDSAISKYRSVSSNIELGDSKKDFVRNVLSVQSDLDSEYKKEPDRYIKKGVKVEIYYLRSSRQPDDLTTDDEFTPYVFNNGKLVAIGWASLGGPKTQGQAVSSTYVDNSNSVIVY